MIKAYCDYCGGEVKIEYLGRETTENGWDIPIIRPVGKFEILYGDRKETRDLCGGCIGKVIKLLETEKQI